MLVAPLLEALPLVQHAPVGDHSVRMNAASNKTFPIAVEATLGHV